MSGRAAWCADRAKCSDGAAVAQSSRTSRRLLADEAVFPTRRNKRTAPYREVSELAVEVLVLS